MEERTMRIWELLEREAEQADSANAGTQMTEASAEARAEMDRLLGDTLLRAKQAKQPLGCPPCQRQTRAVHVPKIKAGWATVKKPPKPKPIKPPPKPRKPKVIHTIPTVSSAPKPLRAPGSAR